MELLIAGDVELNPGPSDDIYCTDSYKHKRKEQGSMIRCCLCAVWCHEDCVGIKTVDDRGVWPCPECRQISSREKLLTGAVEELL